MIVVEISGVRYELTPRLAAMVAWLISRREMIDEQAALQVHFDIGPGKIKPSLQLHSGWLDVRTAETRG